MALQYRVKNETAFCRLGLLFFPAVLFRFRAMIGVCPVTTDWILGDELLLQGKSKAMLFIGAAPQN